MAIYFLSANYYLRVVSYFLYFHCECEVAENFDIQYAYQVLVRTVFVIKAD